jgi:hypothetical protein
MERDKTEKMLSIERIENLMLMAVLGEEPYRQQAIGELKRRRLLTRPERFIDAFTTNLGIIC